MNDAPYPTAASSTAACCLACCCCMTIGPRLRTKKTEDTAAATSSDSQHTASEGYKHNN